MKGAVLRAVLLVAAVAALGALALPAGAATGSPRVLAIHYALEVNPVTQDYLSSQLTRAAKGGYAAAVIVLDTPGGLSDSMRTIVQKELSTPIPVIVYVSPEGARAASAGVWIGQAADVLAMAPQTNIGSSTPISGNGANIGSDLRRKVVNDAAASLRGLAASHGRNAAWADAAVRVASNLTAAEALKQNVIDAVAPTLPALLKQLDGYHTKGPGRAFTLHLAGARIDTAGPGFFTRFLNVLIDPNLISLLFLAGLAGIGYEIFHPGVVLPGALGGVFLVMSLFGLSVLPISWAGLALLLLGVALLVADVHVTSHGALTVTGLICLVVGSLLLFHNAPSPYSTSVPLVATIAAGIGGFWAFAIGKAMAARHAPVSVGPERVAGDVGEVRPGGLVFVDGELWNARPIDGRPLQPGEQVRIDHVEEGLVLAVRHDENGEAVPYHPSQEPPRKVAP